MGEAGVIPDGHAPIAIFAFNRPAHLSALFESLARCAGFAESPVRVFVDGPRHGADEAAIAAVRAVLDGVDHPDISISYARHNQGLRSSIAKGVTATIAEFGRAIVLEDDLVLASSALTYFNNALIRYAADERIWSISGYIPDIRRYRDHPDALVFPFAHSWGWATWARAWRHFDLTACPSPSDLSAAAFRQAFDVNGFYPMTNLMKLSMSGQVNSWYIHWNYVVFRNDGRSIFPPRRVLDNYGFSAGTHGTGLNPHEMMVRRPFLREAPIALPAEPHIDYAALDDLRTCWEARVQRTIAKMGAAKRRLAARR